MRPPARGALALFLAALVLTFAGTQSRAQSVREPAPGVLLVASEGMSDPRFRRAVVLVIRHDSAGSWGLIINRPTDIDVREVLPAARPGSPSLVHFGGPVQVERLIALFRSETGGQGSPSGLRGVHWSDSPDIIRGRLEADPEGTRVYAGYAGWSPGQLAMEIAIGGWRMIEGRDRDVFHAAPGHLWRRLTDAIEGIAI